MNSLLLLEFNDSEKSGESDAKNGEKLCFDINNICQIRPNKRASDSFLVNKIDFAYAKHLISTVTTCCMR